jgi:inhibitor of KinA sporulation pathway (predicted exonuclease)
MTVHPREVVLLDTEFTAWAGSMDRGWSGPGEYKEIVQIGAVAVDAATLMEVGAFEVLVKPVKNPVLSDYLVALTHITNERLMREAVDLPAALARFLSFASDRPLHSYGRDDRIIAGNAALIGRPKLWPDRTATDLKEWLMRVGVPLAGVHSGELAAHVGSKAQGVVHDALADSRSLAEAVRYLVARGAPNPFLTRRSGNAR